MKKASYIFEVMRTHFHSNEFLTACKMNPKAFIRNRLLPFPVIFLFILNLLKKSIPKELISFCGYCKLCEVSRSAITQARAKLSPDAFIKLNYVLVNEFYNDNVFNTFQGLIVIAIDGSTIELPINSPEIKQKYGCASNQTKREVPMARISHFFDVLNGITWDARIGPYNSNERNMAIQHFEAIKLLEIDLKKLLVIFDRGYPSLALITYLLKNGISFLMRSGRKFLKEIAKVVKAGKRDSVIQISLKRASRAAKAELKELFPSLNQNEEVAIRIVNVTLSTGENEVLITSLFDKEQYPYKIFQELYFMRWKVEENYKFHKGCQEIENFSGKSPLVIEQDFHASLLAANVRALLSLEAARESSRGNSKDINTRKYAYEINKKIAMDRIKNDFVAVLLDPEADIEQFCIRVKQTMKRHLVPIRPGRSFKRIRKHPHRKYHMNQR